MANLGNLLFLNATGLGSILGEVPILCHSIKFSCVTYIVSQSFFEDVVVKVAVAWFLLKIMPQRRFGANLRVILWLSENQINSLKLQICSQLALISLSRYACLRWYIGDLCPATEGSVLIYSFWCFLLFSHPFLSCFLNNKVAENLHPAVMKRR